MSEQSNIQYIIINRRTNDRASGVYKCRRRARHRANKLDLEYGAINYKVCEINADGTIGRTV